MLASTYEGISVLDLSTNLAGPLAAMILGDLGADVIKVERPGTGDDTRTLPPRWGAGGTVFLSVNRSKRSIVLDLRTPEGREALLRLAESADAVIESFGPAAGRLGLRFEDFRERNPQIIHCTVTAFGGGPIGRQLPGYDALVQAFSGVMSITGHPGTPPVRVGPSLIDISTGLWAAIAVMAALARRTETSEAEHVEAALVDSAFSLMCHQVIGFLATGEVPVRLGSAAPSTTPYEVFEAADGWLMVGAATDPQFRRLCRALDLVELAEETRFRTARDRVAAREELHDLLERRFVQESVAVWIERLRGAAVSVGRVNDLREALSDPLTSERGLLVESELGGELNGLPQLRLPIDPDGSCIRRPPPGLGEHTVTVLREAGFGAAEIEELVAQARAGGPIDRPFDRKSRDTVR